MPNQVKNAMFLTVALALFGSASFGVTPAAAQARTPDGKPDFSGIWQANTTANWDLQTHAARPMVAQPGVYPDVPVLAAPVVALGTVGWVPPGMGVVEGDEIPYQPWAAQRKRENAQNWLDRTGNFHSNARNVVERYTPISPDAIQYEATIEDSKVFTRPWKISFPLYRRLEPNAQLMDFRCVEMVEETIYGHLRKQQLVKHWEGRTIAVDITRKVPPGEEVYERLWSGNPEEK